MKRCYIGLLAILLVCLSSGACKASNYYANSVDIKVVVNDKITDFDTAPMNQNGRILVPVRAIVEALGMNVTWVPQTQEAIITNGKDTLKLQAGSNAAYYNSDIKYLDVPAQVFNNRLFIPVRFLSESMGYYVRWEDNTQTVYIYAKESNLPVLPVFKVSQTNYTETTIHNELWDFPLGNEFARQYNFSYFDQINEYIINQAVDNHFDVTKIENVMAVVNSFNKQKPYLVCYVEKAQFEGKDAWILRTNWGYSADLLEHLQIFAIDDKSMDILYFETCR